MSSTEKDLNRLVLRPYPNTTYDDRLTRSERLEIIIRNLEQAQKDVKTEILTLALLEQSELDSPSPNAPNPITPTQPNLKPMRAKYRPGMSKPPDARTLKPESSASSSLFVPVQSQSSLARDTIAKLHAYAQGTPAGLQKFYAARERIAREEEGWGGGESGAGGGVVGVQGVNGGEVSRDPRLRR